MDIDLNLITDVEWDNIEYSDAPDYCNAYITAAYYDGEEMSDDTLCELNDNSKYADWRYQSLLDYIY